MPKLFEESKLIIMDNQIRTKFSIILINQLSFSYPFPTRTDPISSGLTNFSYQQNTILSKYGSALY